MRLETVRGVGDPPLAGGAMYRFYRQGKLSRPGSSRGWKGRKEEEETGGKKTDEKMEKENLGFPGGSAGK